MINQTEIQAVTDVEKCKENIAKIASKLRTQDYPLLTSQYCAKDVEYILLSTLVSLEAVKPKKEE